MTAIRSSLSADLTMHGESWASSANITDIQKVTLHYLMCEMCPLLYGE